MASRSQRVFAWMLVAAATFGCSGRGSEPRSVVLVTVDTLRADHLGAYGYGRATSPGIDALARDSTLFEMAIPSCPTTAPSVASILTGLHRASHRVIANGWILPADVETLAEILRSHNYRTIARVANPSLDEHFGFAQGFDDFGVPAALERTGPGQFEGGPLVEEAGRVIDGLGAAPFFLWLHFMDPHGPYFPPESYRSLFDAASYQSNDEPPLAVAPINYGLSIIPSYQAIDGSTSPGEYRARYDAEIRYVDDHIQALVRKLRERGLLDHVVFILTADHGESLGEHRYYFQHGWYAYQDSLRVPLLLRASGVIPGGKRIPQPVSLVDLAPTILDLVGLPVGPAMEGKSLVPLVRAGAADDRAAFAQTYYGDGLVALLAGRFKYIFKPPQAPLDMRPRVNSDPPDPAEAREELYDLELDPGEMQNLAATRPDALRTLRARTEQWLDDQKKRAGTRLAERPGQGAGGPVRLRGDPQLERQLRALGYVE